MTIPVELDGIVHLFEGGRCTSCAINTRVVINELGSFIVSLDADDPWDLASLPAQEVIQ